MTYVRSLSFAAIACAALGAAACSNEASVAFTTGMQFELSTDSLALPAGLRSDTPSGPILMGAPCGAMGMCPTSTGADGVSFECVGGVCDPSPKTLSIPVGDVVDLDVAAGDLRNVLAEADHVDILRVTSNVTANTLTIDLPAVEIFWGPEGATAIDEAMGVHRLGTMPPIVARTTGGGEMVIDTAGRDALSTYIVTMSKRLKFFGRTVVDLMPGGPYPEGAATVSVSMDVEARSQIVR